MKWLMLYLAAVFFSFLGQSVAPLVLLGAVHLLMYFFKRKKAEQKRKKAEQLRKKAEQKRKKAEQKRKEAEQKRKEAEQRQAIEAMWSRAGQKTDSFYSNLQAYEKAIETHVEDLQRAARAHSSLYDDLETWYIKWQNTLNSGLPPIAVCQCNRDVNLRNLDALGHRIERDKDSTFEQLDKLKQRAESQLMKLPDIQKGYASNAKKGREIHGNAQIAVADRSQQAFQQANEQMDSWSEQGRSEAKVLVDVMVQSNKQVMDRMSQPIKPLTSFLYPCVECIRRQAEEEGRRERAAISRWEQEQQDLREQQRRQM